MSRAPTTLNLLLAAMFLVSLMPAAMGASDPATDDQEAAIEGVTGIDVPTSLPWTVRNELHTLHLAGPSAGPYALSYDNPPSNSAANVRLTPNAPTPNTGPGLTPAPAPVFRMGSPTVAQTEITTFSAQLFLTSTSESTVTVDLLNITGNTTTVVETLTIPIRGVIINLPAGAANTPTEFTASKSIAKLVAPNATLAVRISASSTNPLNVVTLYWGSGQDSRVGVTADSTRVKAWTEKDGSPGIIQTSFGSPANAGSEERTLRFILTHVQSLGQQSQNAQPIVFQILGPDGKVVFESTGSPIGVTAPVGQRWGAASPLPADDLLGEVDGVSVRLYKLTFPQTLNPGQYLIHMCVKTCAGNAPSTPFDLPINIGASKGNFELAAAEAAEKVILVGQRTTFRLTLTNNGGVEDTYALQTGVGNLQPGWSATIAPAQVKLAPGASTAVELTVIPPANGASGQSNTVTATATSLLSGSSFSLPQTLRVVLTNTRTSGVEILNATNATTAVPEPTLRLTVAPGGNVAIPAIVQNLGNGFDRVVVSLSGAPAGWTASANPALLELGARSQGASILRVEAPSDAVPSSSFLLTMKASRLDNLSQSDTQLYRIVVAEIDAFAFKVFNGTAIAQSTPTSPIVHVIRDEGPDGSKTSSNECSAAAATGSINCWDGTPDADTDFDTSTLFQLILSNEGSRQDTYTLTPYLLTAGGTIPATLAGETSATSFDVRTRLGYQDLDGCEESDDNGNGDGINDGWRLRIFEPDSIPEWSADKQTFNKVREGVETVTVPAGQSKLVYVEMKWVVPNPVEASSGCAGNHDQGTTAGARPADPAPGHAVLIEAVSTLDASHRATHVLNAMLEPAGNRISSQRYAGQTNAVAVVGEAGEDLTKAVTADTGARTATYSLRAVNMGNEMDTLRVTVPQFICPPTGAAISNCWEQTVPAAALDKRLAMTNPDSNGGRSGAGTCTTPAVSNPSASLGARVIAFECTLGAFDEFAFKVTSTAPSSGVIGQAATVRVTTTSKDSFAGSTSIFDTVDLVTSITGKYALEVTTTALQSAPVHPGESSAIPFTLRNLGTSQDNVTLDLRETLPAGWTGDFSVPNPVFVPAGRDVDLLLFVKAPAGAAKDTVQKFEVRATSGDSPAIVRPADNLTLSATVLPKSTLLNITGEPANVLGKPGDVITATVKVTRQAGNSATAARLMIDQATIPDGWTATLDGATSGVHSVTYNTAGVATATLSITPDEDALGSSRAAIRVLADDATSGTFVADEFTHLGVSLSTPNLGVDFTAPEGTTVLVAPGSATNVRLTVENLGVSQDVIRLTTGQLPTGWNAVFQAENITLQPLQKRSINVTVTAPADLTSGQSRLLTFIATTSDGVRADTVHINFTTGGSVLGLVAKVEGTRYLLPLEPVTFTVTVNNTGDLVDDIVLRSGAGTFKDVVGMTFEPAAVTLQPDEARDVTVRVTLPEGLPPRGDVPLVIEAASKGPFLKSLGTTTVTAKVLDYKVRDIDGDGLGEYAADRDLIPANGYESIRDPSTGAIASKAVDAATFLSAAARSREPNFLFDPDKDGKADHLVDLDNDGKPDVYWDPDLQHSHVIPLFKDVTGDGRDEFFFDTDGVGGGINLDRFYDPLENKTGLLIQVDIDNNGILDYVVDSNGNGDPDPSETVIFNNADGLASIRELVDVDGKAKGDDKSLDSVIDSDANGKPDYFIPAGKTAGIEITLEDVNGDGIDDWTFDSDGDGIRDMYFDPAARETREIDARGSFLDDLTKYWYVSGAFGLVLVLFVVLLLVTRR